MVNLENKNKLRLVEGEFSNEEAREFLMNFFSSGIQYLEMKNFSSTVRFGKSDKTALMVIPQLKNNIEELLTTLSEEKLNKRRIYISSEIKISLFDD